MTDPFPKYIFSRTDQLILALFVLIYAAVATFLIVSGNNGVFTYTLDDAYIHLSMAENILHGTYGVNAGEFAAPSSSVVWPFILALFSWTVFSTYVPLALNIIISVFSLVFIYRTSVVALGSVRGTEADTVNRAAAVILTVVLALAANMLGVMFTGLEHSLQILLECLVFYGLVRVILEEDSRRLLYVSIVLLPLVRYEGTAVSLAALAVLFIVDSKKRSLIVFAVMAAAIYLFSIFLFANSGWFFPSSVILKGGFTTNPVLWDTLTDNLLIVLRGSRTLPLMYAVVVLLPVFVYAGLVKKARLDTSVSFIALAVIGAYFFWFGNGGERYLIPVYVLSALAGIILLRGGLRAVFGTNVVIGGLLVLALAGMMYPANYFYQKKLPLAAANIYEQHYHMHRFVTEFYRKPVAANDIGYISYRNPRYVLDLAGLANYDVMESPHPMPAQMMDSLVHAKGVDLVMIYDDWFKNIPDTWTNIGAFVLNRRKTVAAGARVSVYAADPAAVHYARSELKAFRLAIRDSSLVELHPE